MTRAQIDEVLQSERQQQEQKDLKPKGESAFSGGHSSQSPTSLPQITFTAFH